MNGLQQLAGLPGRILRPGRNLAARRRSAAVYGLLLLLTAISILMTTGHAYGAPATASRPAAASSPSPGPPATSPGDTAAAANAASSGAKGVASKASGAAEDGGGDWQKEVDSYTTAMHTKGGVLGAFNVTDSNGIPVTAYTVDEDTGSWQDWDLKLENMLINGLFLATEWMVAFSCWLIAWSLSFSLAKILLTPVAAVSNSLYTNVAMAMGLPGLCLTIAGVAAAWQWMFGNRGRGWAEFAAALVISALSITALAAPPQLLLGTQGGAVGKVREFSVAVGSLILGKTDADSTGADAAAAFSRPITDSLVETFVVKPNMLLTYGTVFTGSCATQYTASRINEAVYQQSLAATKNKVADDVSSNPVTNPFGWIPVIGDDIDKAVVKGAVDYAEATFGQSPQKAFEKKCVKGGGDNTPSLSKVGDAFFMMIAAALACAFVIGITISFLTSQAWVAGEAMIAKIALTVGVLPGPGRSLLWGRASSVARSFALMIASVSALAIFIVVLDAVIPTGQGGLAGVPGGLAGQFVVVDVLCVGALICRKRLTKATQRMANGMRIRLGNSKLGGTAPANLGMPKQRRSPVGSMLKLGLIAATAGGGGAAFGARRGVTRALASGGRVLGRGIGAGGRAGTALAKFGLKSTVGLPVYGPRAAQRAAAAAQALPGTTAGKAAALRNALTQRAAPARDFMEEYARNLGLGPLINAVRYTRPRPPLSAPPTRRARPTGPSGLRPSPRGASGAAPGARPRLAPPRVATPPASPAQAALAARLHRVQVRRAAAAAPPPPPPTTPPTPPTPPRSVPPNPPRRVPPSARRRGNGRGGTGGRP